MNPNDPPNITNWYQFVYLELPVIFSFILSLATLIVSYRNGQKLNKANSDITKGREEIAENTATTDQVHQIVSNNAIVANRILKEKDA